MAQGVEQLPCVVMENTIESDLNKSFGKISNKIMLSDTILEPKATQYAFSLDLSKLSKRNRDVKLTKVTNDLGAINISPRSQAALIHIKPIVPSEEDEDNEGKNDSDRKGHPVALGSGKRVASTALATTSDEDSDSGSEITETKIEHDYAHRGPSATSSHDFDPESTGNDSGVGGSVCDSIELSDRELHDLNIPWSPVSDHDYENVSSPGNSSTASGPVYSRQPGFTQHAHEVSRPKNKKKKTHVVPSWQNEYVKRSEPTPPSRSKPKRDPLPMRLRALPQSFWQQPNVPHNVPPSNSCQILPPLERESNIEEVRPITPPPEDKEKSTRTPHVGDRKLSIPNTELLFKLFENVEKNGAKKPEAFQQLKRGRPRKVVPCHNKQFMKSEDPYLNDSVTENIFPQLGDRGRNSQQHSGTNTSLQIITLREGDKSVSLPALSVEQNYPQMLSELVKHI